MTLPFVPPRVRPWEGRPDGRIFLGPEAVEQMVRRHARGMRGQRLTIPGYGSVVVTLDVDALIANLAQHPDYRISRETGKNG